MYPQMALATNISRRVGSRNYYARVAVPKELQNRMGTLGKPKREIWKSLNTSDPREAKRLARPIVDSLERQFEEMRLPRTLTETELQDAVWKRYLELITADEKLRQSLPSSADLDQIWKHLEAEFGPYDIDAFRIYEMIKDTFQNNVAERSIRFTDLRRDTGRGETELVADAVRTIINARRLDLENGSPEHRKLAQGVQRAELEALKRAEERDAGDFSGEPKDRLVQPPTLVVHARGETIMELYDRFKRENANAVAPDAWRQNRKLVALFNDFVGGKAHVSALTRKNVRDWKANLFKWPVKAAEITVFKGLSFLEVIEKNEKLGKPAIQVRTINRYLSALGGFSTWLLSNDFIKDNPMTGMYLNFDRDEKKVHPYTPAQLKTIFSSPLFTSCAGKKREHEAGAEKVRDWRYWIPLIALYTGARLGEIAQLMPGDIRQLHGVWIFHVTKEGAAGKSVKTKGSQRVIPMHSKLVEIGLLDYHASKMATPDSSMFPEIERDARGFVSGKPSMFFNDYFREIGVKADRTRNFHSLRHGMADAFRVNHMDEEFAVLLGHAKATTTGRYGNVKEGVLSRLIEIIEAVSFPTVVH
ncbi:site-specific integrase [Tardiphaga sp. vice352]|nr:site-specific integrase [Tardiphaga sp. vice278]QDM32030.1 site-specific integrase [Tardiphaga sp. vice352]